MREGAVTLVEYKVQSDKIGEQEAAVQEWVGAIRALGDPNVSYTVLKAEDGLSLRHVILGCRRRSDRKATEIAAVQVLRRWHRSPQRERGHGDEDERARVLHRLGHRGSPHGVAAVGD